MSELSTSSAPLVDVARLSPLSQPEAALAARFFPHGQPVTGFSIGPALVPGMLNVLQKLTVKFTVQKLGGGAAKIRFK